MVSTLKQPQQLQNDAKVGETRVVFHNLTWNQYAQILAALPQARAARLSYLLGTLEISMPLEDHEQASELIGLFIRILVVELGLKLKSMRSTTLAKEDLDRGSEPDNAYYIQNQPKVAGRNVDLASDPPPDLVVEVDITHTDIDKNRLYEKMGVPELWRFNGHVLEIYQLQDDQYVNVPRSPTFPIVDKADFYRFLDRAKQDEVDAEVEFREQVRSQLQSQKCQ